MRILMTVVAASLVSATPSFAKNNAQQPGDPQESVSTASNAEKKVCKRLPVTGSRMTERVCLTKADWKKVEEAK